MTLQVRNLFSALALVCLAFTSCGNVRGERVTTGVRVDSANVQLQRTELGRGSTAAITVSSVTESEAFAFSAIELNSRRALVGSDLVGDGPVVITFVVPRCPICVTEGPELGASAAENPDVTFIVVHSGGTADAYDDYVSSSGLTSSNVVHLDDSPGLLWARFGVVQQPTSVLIDVDGKVSQSLGALGEKVLGSAILGLRNA